MNMDIYDQVNGPYIQIRHGLLYLVIINKLIDLVLYFQIALEEEVWENF